LGAAGLESARQQVRQPDHGSAGDQHNRHGGRESTEAFESRPAVAAVQLVKRLLVTQALLARRLQRSVAGCVEQYSEHIYFVHQNLLQSDSERKLIAAAAAMSAWSAVYAAPPGTPDQTSRSARYTVGQRPSCPTEQARNVLIPHFAGDALDGEIVQPLRPCDRLRCALQHIRGIIKRRRCWRTFTEGRD
jgi:hypothetical protein